MSGWEVIFPYQIFFPGFAKSQEVFCYFASDAWR